MDLFEYLVNLSLESLSMISNDFILFQILFEERKSIRISST